MCVCVLQSCLTLCDPMDCSLLSSSVHGILRAGILEWVAISFSRGSSWPRDRTWISSVTGRFCTVWSTREALVKSKHKIWASQVALVVKNTPAYSEDIRDGSLISGLGKSPGGGHGNPPQYSHLEDPMGRGAWWAAVHRVTKSWTRLKQLSTHTQT